MNRQSRSPITTLAMGALVLSMGLVVQPASAGGHHRGQYVGQLVAVPAGGHYVAGPSLGLVPVQNAGISGFCAPAVASYYATPVTPAGYSYYSPNVAYYGYNAAAIPATSGTAGLAGFTPAESAAYAASPALANHLGGHFPLLHRKIATQAQALGKSGKKRGELLQILKVVALPILSDMLGVAAPGSGPIFDELMKLVEGIAGQVGTTTTPAGTGDAPATPGTGTTINVFLDTKTGPPTATAVVVAGKPGTPNPTETGTGAGAGNQDQGSDRKPSVPDARQAALPPTPKPAGDDQPSMKDLKASIDKLAEAVQTLSKAIPAK